MLRGKHERDQKQRGLQQHNARPRGRVDEKTQVDPKETRAHRTRRRDEQHPVKPVRQQIADAARRHQHRDHENDAHGLQRDHDRHRQQRQQEVMEHIGAQSDRPGMTGIKAVEQEVAAQREHDGQSQPAHDQRVPQIPRRQPEDVAKQDVVEMQVAFHLRENHEPKRKQPCEHHAHHGIFLHPGVGLDVTGRHRTQQPRRKRADRQRQPDRIRDHDPRQHRMRNRVAHERPPLEHEITRKHRTHRADRHADDHRIDHERKLKRFEQRVHPGNSSASPAARRRVRCAISPCFGAKTSAATKSALCNVTMHPPVEPSKK